MQNEILIKLSSYVSIFVYTDKLSYNIPPILTGIEDLLTKTILFQNACKNPSFLLSGRIGISQSSASIPINSARSLPLYLQQIVIQNILSPNLN